MATILNADIQVDYLADNRQKRLSWLGGTNLTYTMNEIYSAMATLLDETTTIDDGTCFSAETPVEYTIGKIDTGDTEPWYITFDLMEHITGGALRTSGWTWVVDTNAGVLVVPVASGGTITAADDEGLTMTHADGDVGTLVEFIDTGGTTDYLVIRPLTSALANDFNTAAGVITSSRGAFTATQNAASTTGEQIWANLYSLGTIDPNVHLYQYQGPVATDGDRVRLFSWNDNTQDWYDNGHIDICVALKDITLSTWDIIDDGYITVLARKYGDLYASFEVACSTTSGGRNPIPLQTAADLDNSSGIWNITYTAGSGTFIVGDIILGGTSGARGIVTFVDAGVSLTYISIDDPQIAFTAAEAISASATTGTGIGAPSAAGPSLSTWFTSNSIPTAAFTYIAADIDDNSVNENYGITIDCLNNPLTEVYEWIKYATRNGETTSDLDGINGEDYIGGEVYLAWTGAVTGTIAEGDDVTQAGTGATGVIIAFNDVDDATRVILLRDTRGTFDTSGLVTSEQGGNFTPTSVSTFAPKTASPLGTFAGGTFFGARGVLLTNYLAADANSFILTPIEGGTKERPPSITMTVTNLVGGLETSNLHDRVSIFRLTGAGADIDKTEYACDGGEAVGANSITVGASITQDTVGKSGGGTLVLVDISDNGAEYKLRYSSWTGLVFTLDEITGTATGGSTTTLIDSGGGFDGNVFRGDLVTVNGESVHVKTVDSDIQLTFESTLGGAVANLDTYEINTSPILIDAADKVYVPFIDRIATTDQESVSVTYASQIYYRAKVRNTRATIKIKPFSVDGTTTGSDVSVATIRTADTIIQ